MIISKLKKLSPLLTYIIGSFIAIVAQIFSDTTIYIYYTLLLIAFGFVLWAVIKYFSKAH